LLDADLPAELAQRRGQRTVRVLRAVAGDAGPVAQQPDELEGQHDARRRLERRRQDQAECGEARFNPGHE